MTTKEFLLFNLIAVNFIIVLSKTGPTHDKLVVCYLAGWAVYRPGKGSYTIENFDPDLCTHVVYAFSGLDTTKDAIKSLDPWQDLKDDYGKGGYERINGFKKTHPHLKVSLAIGGWNEGSKNYSIMVSDSARRQRFIKQASEFIRKYKFDGLDLDWEYPTQRGGEPEDKKNFVSLVKELRQEFDKYGLLLTSAIGASKEVIDKAYDVPLLSKYLDFLHIMCYDYAGSWDRRVGPNAPIRGFGFLTIEYTIEYLIKLGASPSKIVLGIPFYGRSFVTNNDGNLGDISDDVGFQGPYTRENGFLGYNEVCLLVSNTSSGWQKSWDSQTSQAIAKYKDEITEQTKVITYDSTRSVANKMKFINEKNLAGAMIWSVDTDDFLGDCILDTDTYSDFNNIPGIKLTIPRRIIANYPLLRTINEAIVFSHEEIAQEKKIKEMEKENEIPHGVEPSFSSSSKISVNIFKISYILVLFLYLF